jgi:galactose mutarotase-like enzyme
MSFTSGSQEFIHQKGNPGRQKSDDEMFPVIGPLDKNNYPLETKKGDGILNQHGLLRELNYQLISHSEKEAVFRKQYSVGDLVRNSKFPEKSSEEFVSWPFDFEFTKHYSLSENQLNIQFTIQSEEGMPFMLGYHPAFLLTGEDKETLESGSKK